MRGCHFIAICVSLMVAKAFASSVLPVTTYEAKLLAAYEAYLDSKGAMKGLAASSQEYKPADWNKPKEQALSTDPTTEEDIPGLQPTDGAARRAQMPDLSPFAPLIEMGISLTPIFGPLMKAIGLEMDTLMWSVDDVKKPKVQASILFPTLKANTELPKLLVTHGGLPPKVVKKLFLPNLSTEEQSAAKQLRERIASQIMKQHVLVKLINDDMMNNGTQVLTKAGETLTIVVKKDGAKYFVTEGGMEAKIVRADFGMGTIQSHFVDSFLFPTFSWQKP